MTVFLKRAYAPPAAEDGMRVLVDRLWPRGLSKDEARIDIWMKEIAPSTALRRWFNHDPAKWQAFQQKYIKELEGSAALDELRRLVRRCRMDDAKRLADWAVEQSTGAPILARAQELAHRLIQRLPGQVVDLQKLRTG